MSDLEATGRLDALEEARVRLEAALEADENWRALANTDTIDEQEDLSADRRARDMRLRLALEANPLYRAWQHVTDAIEAVRESGAVLGPAPTAPVLDGEPAAAEPAAVASIEPTLEAEPEAAAQFVEPEPEPEPEPKTEPVREPQPEPSGAEPATPAPVAVVDIEDTLLRAEPAGAINGASAAQMFEPAQVQTETAEPVPLSPTSPAQPQAPAHASELPPEISDLIRREADENAAEAAVVQIMSEPEPAVVEVEPEPELAAKALDARLEIPSVEPVLPTHLDAARRVDRLEAELREMTERRAAADDASEFDAMPPPVEPPRPRAPKARPRLDTRQPPPEGSGSPPARAVPDEATVTFVSRETKRPLLSSIDLPRTPLFQRLRSVPSPAGEAEAPAEPSFIPGAGKAEEAEVTIVTQPRKREEPATKPAPAADGPGDDPPTAPIRRFLKALSGK